MSAFKDGRTRVEAHGSTWWLKADEAVDKAIRTWCGWDFDGTRIVQRVLRSGECAMDIGANIGWYTVLMSKIVAPAGRVYAFEPMEEAADILQEHVRLNNCNNVVVLPYALDAIEKQATEIVGYSYTAPRTSDHEACIVVRKPLDTVVSELDTPHVSLIKIDTDGCELRVFRGAEQLLRRDKPMLYFELGDGTLYAHRTDVEKPYVYGDSVRECLAFLTSLGYRLFYNTTWPEPRNEALPIPIDDFVLRPVISMDALLNYYPGERALYAQTTDLFACIGKAPWEA